MGYEGDDQSEAYSTNTGGTSTTSTSTSASSYPAPTISSASLYPQVFNLMLGDPFSCPDDTQPYACSGFSGCCTNKLCNGDGHCPTENFQPASVNISDTRKIYCRAGINLEKCNQSAPSLRGCCNSGGNACSDRCPQGDLTQGFLHYDLIAVIAIPSAQAPPISQGSSLFGPLPTSTNTADAPSWGGGSVQGAPTAQGSSSPTSVSSKVQAAATASQLPSQSPTQTAIPVSKTNTPAIAGGVVGGIVGLALLIGLLFICCRRRTTKPGQQIEKGSSPTWSSEQARSIETDDAELEEMKQGPSPSKSHQLPIQSCIELISVLQHLPLCARLHPHLRIHL